MQYNYIFTLNKVRKSRTFSIGLKLLVFTLVSGYIGYIIRYKPDLNIAFKNGVIQLFQNYPLVLSVTVLLLVANWALEAWKWQYLSKKLESISFWKAMRGVFTGVTLGFVTPLGLGEYTGRILHLNHPDRSRSLGAVFLCRIAQFYVTVICGGLAIVFYTSVVQEQNLIYSLVLTSFIILTTIFLFLFILFYKRMILLTEKISLLNKLYPYLSIISEYKPDEIRHVIFISFIRYFVFTLQFILLLRMFDVIVPWDAMLTGIFFVFIAKSVIPTLFDLGVREGAAVFFFSAFTNAEENILFASLSLWVINLLIPALIGLFFIFRLKIFPES